MKLQLNKLMASLVLAGSVATLVGCGSGDTPAPTVQANSVTTITPATVAQTKALVAAATGASFTLPALNFANATTGAAGAAATNGSVLTLSNTTATGSSIADFKLTAPAGSTGEVNGVVEAGSCRFRVTTSTGAFAASWVVGSIYVVNPCAITLPTAGTGVGSTVTVNPSLTLGTTTVTTTNRTVTLTVAQGTGNTATIVVGGSTITVVPLPTGVN